VPAIVDEILALKTQPDVLWLQLEISHEGAEAKARAAGMQVVTNMCTKQQHQRLIGA
jgi:predicted CoA-binding protein